MIRLTTGGGVATVTLDSPANRNALSRDMITALVDAFAAACADPGVRVILLTHTGPVFCAGADLKETAAAFARDGGGAGEVPAGRLGEALAAVWDCPKPVLTRVAGGALAGGLGLLAAADIAVCAEDVTFAFSEVRLGVVPAVISSTVLPRLAPRAAADLFLTGEAFDGRQAARIGLVTEAVPADALDEAVERRCAALLRGAPGALAGTKELLRRQPAGNLAARLAELTPLSVRYFTSAEGREGVAAMLAKRDPAWVPDTGG